MEKIYLEMERHLIERGGTYGADRKSLPGTGN